jgi:ABC-2 type transport system permease protein
MSGNEAFQLVTERGWTRGLPTILRSGLSRWFHTRMWWIHALIWGGVVGGILAMIPTGGSEGVVKEDLYALFCIFAGLFPAVGVIIIMQDALVGEKVEGTAAWVLSKPLTRPAFLLSKILANIPGILLSMVVVPGLMAYVVFSIRQIPPSPLEFMAALGILFINQLYYLALTLMLGTFFNNRGPVIGLPLAILFLQQNLIGFLPALRYFLPWLLAIPIGDMPSLVLSLVMGLRVEKDLIILLGCIIAEIILFTLIGLWRFNKEEF